MYLCWEQTTYFFASGGRISLPALVCVSADGASEIFFSALMCLRHARMHALQEGQQSSNSQDTKTVAQATASLYGVKTYTEQLAFKEEELKRELFLKLPRLVR